MCSSDLKNYDFREASGFETTEQVQKKIIDLEGTKWINLVREMRLSSILATSLEEFQGIQDANMKSAWMSLVPPTLSEIQGGNRESISRLTKLLRDIPAKKLGVKGSISDISSAIQSVFL